MKSSRLRFRSVLHAFTLVELLIALSIIAVLAGVLTPVFLSARTRAGANTCASNLRQLHQSVTMYAADNEGYLPPYTTAIQQSLSVNPFRAVDRSEALLRVLHPYTKSADIWFCPADPYARTEAKIISDPMGSLYGEVVNHKYTSYLTSDWWYGPVSRVDRLFTPVLGKTPLDLSWWDRYQKRGGEISTTLLLYDMIGGCGNDFMPPYSHNGRFNFLFFDGHIRSATCWE